MTKHTDHQKLESHHLGRLWPKDTAGGQMTKRVPIVLPHQTLADVQHAIGSSIGLIETINYVYVVDEKGKLTGVLSIKDLYRYAQETRVGNICKSEGLVTVKPHTDQEHVAYVALKHHIKAVPVVDHDKTFLGVIPSDVILHILYRETHEDALRLAGVHHHARAGMETILDTPLFESFKHRFPWLFVGLIGGLLVAKVVGFFEQTLEQNIILASFIPLIVYMSDAVGTQIEAFFIRDIAMDRDLPIYRYFIRQLIVIFCIAVCFGIGLFGISAFLYGGVRMGAVLGISLSAAIVSSVCTGLMIPYAASRMGVDPANASGPMATMLQDMISVVIYLGVATVML
ncbi:MAG: magnesium transporter [Candidatus Peregrinibacteria bacterium]|nr:magnesium transporter [Candidatus Peregrinibacteria bacterium]